MEREYRDGRRCKQSSMNIYDLLVSGFPYQSCISLFFQNPVFVDQKFSNITKEKTKKKKRIKETKPVRKQPHISLYLSSFSAIFFFLSKSVKQIAETKQWLFPPDGDFALYLKSSLLSKEVFTWHYRNTCHHCRPYAGPR